MPLSKDDRLIFSLKQVSAADQIKSISAAQGLVQSQVAQVQQLDNANKNLFDPVNTRISSYQVEFGYIDGNSRTTISEQNILDAVNKKLKNSFFPNDTTTSVPSLSSFNNVWTKVVPFALNYGIGKNYSEAYTVIPNENNLITTALGYITSSNSYTDIQNTTGQSCTPGVPTDTIANDPAIQTLASNLIQSINDLKAVLLSEVSSIVTNDTNPVIQSQNNAAINDINNIILPALNTWLGYVTFNTAHGQTTCTGFNGYNSNLLAPTKLHSTQKAALQSALLARQSFLSTRVSQLNSLLGTIVQDVNTGSITSSSGLYGQRYSFLVLRIDSVTGSLTQLNSFQSTINAQEQIKSTINQNKNTYFSILPTSIFAAPANGTNTINLTNASFLSVGDTVYIAAENQEELQRAVKNVSGNVVTLNDTVPSKYRPADKARLYKDLT